MAAAPDTHGTTALELAAALRRGAVSSVELTRLYLERIAGLDGLLSSFVTVLPRRALRSAAAADAERRTRAADALPVFHGVPSAIKDIDMVRGVFVRAGSRAMRWMVAPVDGEAVRRIKAGGCIVLGKTATSELAIMPVTEPEIHPPTRNPWNLEHTSGGSSGGAAAAVAAGLLPIAHASDGGGSIRIPAAFCHLYGFKPSRTLLPNFYAASDPFGLSATGCVAHAVADSAAMLDVLRAAPRAAGTPEASLLLRSARVPGPLRVRVVLASSLAHVDADVRQAVERTARVLEALGHHVEEGAALDVGEVREFVPLMARVVANVPILSRRLLQPVTAWMHRMGKTVRVGDAARVARDLEARVRTWFGDADLVLTPTVAVPAPRVGAFRNLGAEDAFAAASTLGAFTAPFNVSGQPAASLPAGLTRDGLPIGVQLVGPHDADLRVLQVSRQLEEAMPWRARVPPLLEQATSHSPDLSPARRAAE